MNGRWLHERVKQKNDDILLTERIHSGEYYWTWGLTPFSGVLNSLYRLNGEGFLVLRHAASPQLTFMSLVFHL